MATVTNPLVTLSDTGAQITIGGNSVTLLYPEGTGINNGRWHYVTVTLAEGKAKLYLDGNTGEITGTYTLVPPPV